MEGRGTIPSEEEVQQRERRGRAYGRRSRRPLVCGIVGLAGGPRRLARATVNVHGPRPDSVRSSSSLAVLTMYRMHLARAPR